MLMRYRCMFGRLLNSPENAVLLTSNNATATCYTKIHITLASKTHVLKHFAGFVDLDINNRLCDIGTSV